MPLPVNTITRCIATFTAAPPVEYSDWEPGHIKQARFSAILEGDPLSFRAITTDGAEFGVNLQSGALWVDEEHYSPDLSALPTKLRLIYYKRMEAGAGEEAVCLYFVVGWQTTSPDGKNVKVGIKAYPKTSKWEITEDI